MSKDLEALDVAIGSYQDEYRQCGDLALASLAKATDLFFGLEASNPEIEALTSNINK